MSILDRQCVAFARLTRAQFVTSVLWNGKTILESQGLLLSPIYVRCGEQYDNFQTCKVRITFDGLAHGDDTLIKECVRLSASNHDFDAGLTLYVQAPKSLEALLLQSIQQGIQLTVTGLMGLSDHREIVIDPESGFVNKQLEDAHLSWGIGDFDPPQWVGSTLKNVVWAQFEKYPLLHRSQVWKVYQEFADSFGKDAYSLVPTAEEVDAIVEVISDVRSSLRPYKKLSGDEDSFGSTWFSSPQRAKEISAKLSSDEAKTFCKKYDTLWGTFNIYAIVQSGEKDFGALAEDYEPKLEEIEEAAHKLLDMDQRYFSQTLENLLINALIYAETVEYARNVYSKEKFLGVSVPSPLKGLRSGKTDNPLVALSKLLWQFGVEALSIGLTFAAAYFVTSQDSVSSWVITTGLTLYRWVLNLVREVFSDDRKNKLELASAMMGLHDLTNKPIFSSQYVYAEAVRVSQKGAIFKPAVLLLLERQIYRQQKNAQHTHD